MRHLLRRLLPIIGFFAVLVMLLMPMSAAAAGPYTHSQVVYTDTFHNDWTFDQVQTYCSHLRPGSADYNMVRGDGNCAYWLAQTAS